MLQLSAIEQNTFELLKKLQKLPLLAKTRLVGGTALALQIGHRKSIDLDFFGELDFEIQELIDSIKEFADLTILSESKNIHIYSINGIKVDFVNYKYPWIDDAICEDGILLAGIRDIAAMKISAIIGRGTKKDFIDIAFLLQKFSLKDILDSYSLKYSDGSIFMAMKSLTYFDDAESDIMPDMLVKKSWKQAKKEIISTAIKMR
ncbi:hypothetical protein R83H12_01032 [Fibrobacteria bacterium R8-3-H12]